jgi:hypothetical protein
MVILTLLLSSTLATVARADDGDVLSTPGAAATGEAAARDASPPEEIRPDANDGKPPPPSKPPKHCVGWGIAGALGGAAVGYYSVFGIASAAGVDPFQPATFAISVAAEGVGAIAGPMAACRLSDDPRIVPAATFITAGAIAGGAAAGVPTYFFVASARPFGDEGDNPVLSGLTLLLVTTAGGALGGYLGWLVSEAREPASRWDGKAKTARHGMALSPLVTKDLGGLQVGGAF